PPRARHARRAPRLGHRPLARRPRLGARGPGHRDPRLPPDAAPVGPLLPAAARAADAGGALAELSPAPARPGHARRAGARLGRGPRRGARGRHPRLRRARPAPPGKERMNAIGRLRNFVVLLVVAHHAVLAYNPFAPPAPRSLADWPPLWRAFPVA